MNQLPQTSGLPSRPALPDRCLSIDLEVNPRTAEAFAFAAVRHDDWLAIRCAARQLQAGLERLEAALDGVVHPIGHNILQHDLPHLAALRPCLSRLMQAPIDTL